MRCGAIGRNTIDRLVFRQKNMAKRNVLLLGGGGHSRACIEIIESTGKYNILGFFDKDETQTLQVYPYPLLGDESLIPAFVGPNNFFLVAVGQIKTADTRKKLFDLIAHNGGKHLTVISPYSVISSRSSIGEGSIVHHQVIVNTGSQIGKNAILNNKSLIEHDCIVGDHCHISTGAILNGGCSLGNEVFVGSNSTLIQGISVVSKVGIGAGSVVKEDITEPGIYAGNPVRKIGEFYD